MKNLPIKGVYEVAIRVTDLSRSESFYRETLGLAAGLRDQSRKWLFLRAGEGGMIVLQEDGSPFPRQHFAFTIETEDIEFATLALIENGVTIEGPVFHKWMPAWSIYFLDPDGHEIELCAPMKG